MWVSPNHPNPPWPRPDAGGPPQENGQRIATFERHGREELRVNLAEYEGHPYVNLRVWAPGTDGQLWPVKGKGLTVKLREVAGLAEALAGLAERLASGGAGDDGGDRRDGRGSNVPPQGQGGGQGRTAGPQRGNGRAPLARPMAVDRQPRRPEARAPEPQGQAAEPFDEFQDGAGPN